jgi:uroporphyrinogen III methyltransferase/synthase
MRQPLFGKGLVITRDVAGNADSARKIIARGGRPVEFPTLAIEPQTDRNEFLQSLKELSGYDWVIFTSANGVLHTRDRLRELKLDARVFGLTKIAAIGDVSAEAVKDLLCLNVDLCPKQFVAEALADELINSGQVKGKRFLLLRADIARPILREKLQQAGAAEVADIPVYETRPAKELPSALLEAIEKKQLHWITFTSSSTAKNLATLLGSDYKAKLQGVKLASIGPITTQALHELGLPPTLEAKTFNIQGLIDVIAKK